MAGATASWIPNGQGVVGYTASSPNLPVGTRFNSSTGQVINQPSNNNSGGGMQVGGWYNGQQWDGSRLGSPGQVIVGNNSGTNNNNSGGGNNYGIQQPDMSALNAAYDPAFSALDNQVNTLTNTDLPAQLGDISQAAKDLTGGLQTQQTAEDQLTQQQQGILQQQQQSAYSQAARQAAAARQTAINQFGGDSAGQGYSQMADMEMNKAFGDIGTQYTQSLGTLLQHQQDVHTYVLQETNKINQDASQKSIDAKAWLQDQITQIQNARAALGVDKAKAIMSVNEGYLNMINQIKANQQTQLDAYGTWQKQQQFAIDQGLTGLRQSAVNYATSNPFAATTTADNQGTQTTNNTAQQNQSALLALGFPFTNNKDQFSQVQPFNSNLG